MFKTKKAGAASKPAAKQRAKPAAKASKKSVKLAPKALSSTPSGKNRRNVKALLKSATARPAVSKSKKGSPLRKRVSAQTGKPKAPLQAPREVANLLNEDEPVAKAAQAAFDKKGFDILVLQVGEISGLCDKMLLCSARSSTHLSAVSDAVEEALRKAGQRLLHSDGRRAPEPDWVLLDYGDLMVHVFRQQTRADYQLEEYYADGKVLLKLGYD